MHFQNGQNQLRPHLSQVMRSYVQASTVDKHTDVGATDREPPPCSVSIRTCIWTLFLQKQENSLQTERFQLTALGTAERTSCVCITVLALQQHSTDWGDHGSRTHPCGMGT